MSVLKPYRKSLICAFEKRLTHYAKIKKYNKPMLSNLSCKNELKRLQERFVITVVDKASGNFAFTCRKFYFLKLAEELGLDNANPGNDTYRFCPDDEQTICNRIIDDIAKFKIAPPDEQCKLALLYQTPKFHKNPPKMRYIAGNVNCITSQLDDKVARVLKMCKSHFKNLCGAYERYSGIKHCFDTETSNEVKDMFDNAHGKVDSISINDFSTLYTLFDHDHLLSNIRWLFEILSKNSGKHCIKIEYNSARWVADANGDDSYTVGEILEMISFLVKETYVKAFGHIFQQVKGMIMGGKVSGWLSDCSLMVDEFKYVRNKISNGLMAEANALKYFKRYRDDCTTLNCANFLNIAREMYPPSLSLTQENDDPGKANVLDMEVNISEHACVTKIYCKTDHFPFNVISLPFLESNIDADLCHRVFYSQLIRFERLSTHRSDFETRTRFLGNILTQRGYNAKLLERQFNKCIIKYSNEFQKWALPQNIKTWFKDIFKEQPLGLIPPQAVSSSLSQPQVRNVNNNNVQIYHSQP